ncbi:MAG: heavy-metal-associated domain-containing protein [Gemmatimonadales bacterium]|nr:heavy-metal-associated domain-containing protein [Gemmatimonadales bacterium]
MSTSRTALPLSRQVCGGEHLTVERVLSDVEGVVTALVNPASEMAYVEYDPSVTNPDALFAVLKRLGFAPADQVAVRRDSLGRLPRHVGNVPTQGA